jgi:succinyl-diaminopimelate desuccinylase
MSDEWPAPDAVMTEVADERERWTETLQKFIRAPSVNPPGDTTDAADVLVDVLDEYGIDYEIVAAGAEMPNILAEFEGEADDPGSGSHITFNGHLDTYEVGELDRWERDPFSGDVEDGKIYGRGASDMKGGVVATLAAFCHLHDHREEFAGRATFTAVSDEETGGKWGTEYLIENRPEHVGDAVLNGEPSSGLIRFAERGPLWLEITVRGESAHSALPEGLSATEVLVDVLHKMRTDEEFDALENVPADIRETIMAGEEEMDAIYGEGATEFSLRPSMNVGTIEGGGKVNLTAEVARAEVDVRLPIGTSTENAIAWAESVVEDAPGTVTIRVMNRHEPTYTDPTHPLLQSLQENAARARGSDRPPFTCGHGFTDLRFYREDGAPAAYYGPTPYNMGSQNEYITVEEFVESMQVHAATAVEFVADDAQ